MGNKGLVILIVAVLAVLSLPLLITGNKNYTPEQVATKFMDASETGDADKVKPYVTEKAWELSSDLFDSGASEREYKVYQGTVNGNEANVPVEITSDDRVESMSILLRQEDEKWLVYGTYMTVQGMSFTMNFEDPEQMFDDMMDEAMKMIPEEMKSQMTEEMKQMMKNEMKKQFKKAMSDS